MFSDSYYQKVCNRVEGPNLIVMVQIPKNYEKVIEEICAYTNGSGIVYEKKNLLLQISKTKIINLIIKSNHVKSGSIGVTCTDLQQIKRQSLQQ